jgi:16S rRNA processing protein RimM
MITLNDVYLIGTLGKPHGVKGEIAFSFDDDIFDSEDADYLFIMIDGLLVPFFIEEYRFSSDVVALMKFEGIDSLEQAMSLTGCDVYYPRDHADDDDDTVSKAELNGFKLVDAASGRVVGTIRDLDDSTANLLFVVATDNGDRLIPASHELIKKIDKHQQTITVAIPDGLLEI